MSSKVRPSERAASFTASEIHEMTRLAMEHDAVDLAQGFPDFAAPEEIERAAPDAVAVGLSIPGILRGSMSTSRRTAQGRVVEVETLGDGMPRTGETMTLLIAGLAWLVVAFFAARAVGPMLAGARERSTRSTTS